jgi:cytochrome P450
MAHELEEPDFALQEYPGRELHDVLRRHRERHPVTPARFLGQPAFVITGHAALRRAFADDARFPGHRMYQASFEGAIGESFISMGDDARHRVYRKLATPTFRSRAVAAYEDESLVEIARELVDKLSERIIAGETVDLVSGFTASFPYRVITRLLGLPRDRENEFHAWAVALLGFRDDPARGIEARNELTRYLAPIVEERRANPQEDVISGLVQAEIEGRKLSNEEIFSHIRLLFPTGGETTYGTLGNLISTLFSENLWSEIAGAPSRIPQAIDEALRFESSIAVLPRMSASCETEFEGVTIPPDSWLMFAVAGANRDPSVFESPDTFDIERTAGDMLTFGRGKKSCPGMHFAKRNMIVALQVLLERLPALELVDTNAAIPRRSVLRAPDALRVRARR